MDKGLFSPRDQLVHQQMIDSTALRDMPLEELERFLLEKRLFLNRLEAVASNLPLRIESRFAEIQQLMEQMEQLKRQNTLDSTNLEKTIRGVATVKLLLDLTEAEVQLRKNSILDLVELSQTEWNELDMLDSMFTMDTISSAQPPIAASVDMKPALNLLAKAKSVAPESNPIPAAYNDTNKSAVLDIKDTKATRTMSSSAVSMLRVPSGNPSVPSSEPVQWAVTMAEDFQISKSIASRWHITKCSYVLKPLLAGYHNGRIARDFAIALPHLESCAPNTLDCVACNKRIDSDLRVRLIEYCEDCSFHPMCAAVHLDFCATNLDILQDDGTPMTCIGRVFGKCPKSKKSDVAVNVPLTTTTAMSKRSKATTASTIRSKVEHSERKRVKET